ncbi:MAG: signal transduction histidine kinase/ActR/RegA family two-component response regulator [Cognaticolwellia sp.]|jgi:signal transduction histidine kinase/ActR/RegA family two-component response regulator
MGAKLGSDRDSDLAMSPEFKEEWLRRLYLVLAGPSMAMGGFVIWHAEHTWWAFAIQLGQVFGNITISVLRSPWPWIEKGGHLRILVNSGSLFAISLACGPDSFIWILGLLTCFGAVFSPYRTQRIYAVSTNILATLAGMAWVGVDPHEIVAAGLALTSISVISLTLFNALLRTTRSLERRQDEAEANNKELVRALASRQAFLATMSHEVRTPLNGVLGMAEVLSHTRLDHDQRQMLATVKQSGTGLLQVLNDILDTAKLDAGAIQLESVPFNPGQIAESVVNLLRASTRKEDLKLRVTQESLPESVLGDPARVRQVLLNLVGNAIKFTDHGLVGVHLTWSDDRLLIMVRDSGIGIADEYLEHLFEPFTQAEAGTTRRYGGTGLGLTICKRLVEKMDGTLQVRSILGTGSEFFFEIQAPASVLTPTVAEPQHPETKTYHVLLVDDNLVNILVARRMIETLGCTCRTEDDGQKALDTLEQEQFDLVLMDCRMPGMDGFEATRRLRARGMTLPVLALTAGVTQAERTLCEKAGMDDVLPKPLTLDSLRHALAYWPSLKRTQAQ